ncbi:uncharacterized protein DSM5745_05176 [Aspergillus mulundensis]|uniref:gamma-glutamylcyclotransferase n=1 Tax=Aspergillus mulundensis TaxID=1810919 RepID=A0A3D8S5P9_9EURO|nr:hypothetical protein DSM5745_05176 [Aspergillus mulundensis]RDW81619.1 hypothetical protein DSM5745_05176 [Aspergillus mulundensis]
MSPPHPKQHAHKIYFAYGGNMHLRTMAKRCPGARYLGLARLQGYRWQINERGYANVVKVPGDSESGLNGGAVHGLAFLVDAEDEERLDRAEGVPNAYQKQMLNVELVVAGGRFVGRDVSEVMLSSEGLEDGSGRGVVGGGEIVQALVYASKDYVKDGLPRAEYAARMRLGLRDAVSLGLGREYAESVGKVLAAGVRPGAVGGNSPKSQASPGASRRQSQGQRPSTTAAARSKTAPSKASAPTYYFAFGSNMHLAQMAARCPDSKIFARGVLTRYRWQINERGVANIVPVPVGEVSNGKNDSIVQGILFTVSAKDIKTLDANEGIARGFYDKVALRVRVEPLAIPLKGIKTAMAMGEHGQASQPTMNGKSPCAGRDVKEVEALVYLSSQYIKDGTIRNEYIGRMQSAMADALKLGVDEAYLKRALYPWIFSSSSRADGSLDRGKQMYVIIEPSAGAERSAVSGSPKGRRIIERVPGGSGCQLGVEEI